jgi:hypothetical protein
MWITGVTAHPHAAWVTQQARNVTGDIVDEGVKAKFLVRDRDTKYVAGFDEVFRSEGAQILKTPFRTPNANAYRRTVREDDPFRVPGPPPHRERTASRARPLQLRPALQQPSPASRDLSGDSGTNTVSSSHVSGTWAGSSVPSSAHSSPRPAGRVDHHEYELAAGVESNIRTLRGENRRNRWKVTLKKLKVVSKSIAIVAKMMEGGHEWT